MRQCPERRSTNLVVFEQLPVQVRRPPCSTVDGRSLTTVVYVYLCARSLHITLSQCNQSTVSCVAGYYCSSNSLSTVANACPVGQYSSAGAANCSHCAAGYFGNATALASPSCSGNCSAGYYCPAGSNSSTPFACPVGQYSLSGWSSCIPSPVHNDELLALLDVYENTTGELWSVNDGWQDWSAGSDPCSNFWYGVNCTGTTPNHIA